MKREFLEGLDLGEGVKLSKSAVDAIMAEHGKTVTTLTTERDGLKTQLDTANATIQSYKDMDIEGVKQSVKDWETKYDTDTKALKEQLEAVKYGHAVEKAVSGLSFTSESAKKAFISDLTAKQLKLEDGKLLGLEDFTKTYREADPGAFTPEDDGKTPVFTKGGTGGNPMGGNDALRAAFGLSTDKK